MTNQNNMTYTPEESTLMEDQVQQTAEAKKSNLSWKNFLPLIIIVLFMGVAFSLGWHKYLTLEQLALNLETLQNFLKENYISAILAYVLFYMVATALSIPGGAVISITGGLLFGWFVGTLATIVGATIGATLLFLAAKTSLGALLKDKAGPWLEKLESGFKENALSYMFFLRLVPVFPFFIINLAPAFLGVNLSTFVFATFFGIIPGSLAFAYIGEGLGSVIRAQKASYENCLATKGPENCEFGLDFSSLITTELLIAFTLLSLVSLIPVVVKKLKSK